MDRLLTTALVGAFFAILAFIHFFIDWVFQSHAEAMVKHNNSGVRAKHCIIYTSPFVLFLWWCRLSPLMICVASCILFLSHFVEDTYLPVLFWAKYIRKPPEMQTRFHNYPKETISYTDHYNGTTITTMFDSQKQLDQHGFMRFISTPIGKILMISVDQIIHLTFLLPIAYMIAMRCKQS